jgi:hypothetical protein
LQALVDSNHHGVGGKEQTRHFLASLPHKEPGPQLAILYQANLDGNVLAKDIMTHFNEQGVNYSVYEDLRPYLASLSDEQTEVLIESLDPIVKSPESTPANVFRYLNAVKLQAKLKVRQKSDNLPDEAFLLKEYRRLLPMGSDLKETERQYSDDLLLLACQARLSQGKNTDNLLQIAAWLEEGLLHSKHNYQFKLLLARVYLCMGCATRAIKLLESLNLRTVQFDTLGYFFTEPLDSLIVPDDSAVQFARLSSIYLSNLHETPEMISMAYSNGSLSKVPEFIDFFERLRDSVSRSLLSAAQRRLDVWKGLVVDQSDDLLQDAHVNSSRDNRDFEVMVNLLDGDVDAMEQRSRAWPRRGKGWVAAQRWVQSVLKNQEQEPYFGNSECTFAERTSFEVLSAVTNKDPRKIESGLAKLRNDFVHLAKDGLSWDALNTLTCLVECLSYPVLLHGKRKGKPDANLKEHAVATQQLIQSLTKQLQNSYPSEDADVCRAYQLHVAPDWKAALQRCNSKLASLY